MLSERSERRGTPPTRGLGPREVRGPLAERLGVATDRIALAPSRSAVELALFHVLADAGDEVLLATHDALTEEVAAVSGLAASRLDVLDAETLFEAAGERSRVIVVDEVSGETLELLAEIDLPIVTASAAITRHPIFGSPDAPLAIVVGTEGDDAWLAVLGPDDRAEPVLARLESLASVFFARAADAR